MSVAVKALLVVCVGFVILLPLGLIGLSSGAQNIADESCAIPTPSSASPTAAVDATANPSLPTDASRSMAPCDSGDDLPDDGSGGIPAGYIFPSNSQQAKAVAFALAQLGKPYLLGTDGPTTYDCSGLVMKAWAAAGVTIPRTTLYQVDTGVAVTSIAAMEPGDLIFIPGDRTMASPGHVGMYIGRDLSGRQWLVQAPHTGSVIQTTLVSVWASEVAAIRRALSPP